MPAFNHEHERARIQEMQQAGLSHADQVGSVTKNLRTYLLERTGALSPFDLSVNGNLVQQEGYSHREDGDLDASFQLSEQAAENERIAKRYALENEGYAVVKEKFFELPVGSTILLMSPPPDEPIPGYPGHSMAYFYHILPDEGGDENKRTIKALSWVNHFSQEEQAELLNSLGAAEAVEATESSILSNPVFLRGQGLNTLSFRELWRRMGEQYQTTLRPQDFRYTSAEVAERFLLAGEEIWEKHHGNLALMTTDLAERLVRGEGDTIFAHDWDIMLNLADQEFLHVDVTKHHEQETEEPMLPGRAIFDAYEDFSYAPRIVATLCGESAGIGTYGDMFTTATYTVELFRPVPLPETSGEKTLECTCPFCKVKVKAIIKDDKIMCPREDCGKSAPYKC